MSKTYGLSKEKWLELENHLLKAYDIASEAKEYDTSQLDTDVSLGGLLFRGDMFVIKPTTTYKGMDTFPTQDD